MLSVEKNNSQLKIVVGYNVLQKCANLVLQKYSNYLRDCTIKEKDSENFVYFNRKALLEYLLLNIYMTRISGGSVAHV